MTEPVRSLKMIQRELDQYIKQFKEGYFPPFSQLANLIEEVGELASEISHTYGDKPRKEIGASSRLAEELGDVFITLVIMANSFELDLEVIYQENMEKFIKRDAFRFERIDGRTKDLRDVDEG